MIYTKIFNINDDTKKTIKKLDDTYYKNTVDICWYDRYNGNKIIFLYDNDTIIGYTLGAFISEKLYADFLLGRIRSNFDIDIKQFNVDSKYVYAPSILIINEYRGRRLSKLLIEQLNKLYANKSIIFMTVSREGFNICKKNYKLINNINENISIFTN